MGLLPPSVTRVGREIPRAGTEGRLELLTGILAGVPFFVKAEWVARPGNVYRRLKPQIELPFESLGCHSLQRLSASSNVFLSWPNALRNVAWLTSPSCKGGSPFLSASFVQEPHILVLGE